MGQFSNQRNDRQRWIQTDKNTAGNEEEIMRSYIEKAGVCFLTIPHLAKTYLDGAAMILENQLPVIALTLRYTRIDNFLFCLLHELAQHALIPEDTWNTIDLKL